MSFIKVFNQVVSSAQRPVEANRTNSNDPTFSRIIPAKDRRITILSEDGKQVINENEGFLDELAYHMDGPFKLYSNEYVDNYKSFTYFGQPTSISYQDARPKVSCEKLYKEDKGTPEISKVFPFFVSKSGSDPRTMVFNIKDLCYIKREAGDFDVPPVEIIREVLVAIVSDFKNFTSIENESMNTTCRQNVKIANNYEEFPFSRIIASNELRRIPTVKLFLSDSLIKTYNVEQIEELLVELLRFVKVPGEGGQQSNFENFEVETSIWTLSNGLQEYHFHLGRNYNMSADQFNKLEFSVEHALRDIVLHGYSASNAHPFGMHRGVVMIPFIQNFKLVTTEEEDNNFSRNIGQPPPYNQQ